MNLSTYRPRRLREKEPFRRMIRETVLSVDSLIMPYFVVHGQNICSKINAMPGIFHFSIDRLIEDVKETQGLGIPAVLLFGLPDIKDEAASEAYAENGIIQQAVRAIKSAVPDIMVITDVCLCEYTSHGHCGIPGDGRILNDESVELLVRIALSHARAGADMIAPSDMMDGRIKAIRHGLDLAGYTHIPIMSYAAKYASAFYGPFRQAAQSTPAFSDRQGYQMDPANIQEASREVELDIWEGADIVMVKPGLAYMDVVWQIKQRFGYPTAVYNVSGEYAMVKAASQAGFIDEKKVVMEIMLGMRRAGADIIISYHAKDVAGWLRQRE
ncbi:delta-aminolevulinic acid dehydratase [Candidatus Desantisbacteria bacterium CG2_30_40_21]|uniref:Delta-aminolevulinic acid dehydratase n=1 Tax=Candidatus Desantisbacteria bacterium CG2_30_40_21 TaxID=1817895 RepID=A0A1J5DQD8_9BACT|nr:MAG: delta-aminolevulinic acid dehydratase [Candidatus Desantisbacteria bacterium CG2_30_40_21]